MHRSVRLIRGRWSGGAILSVAALALFACDRPELRETAKREVARGKLDPGVCADQAGYERLKAATFQRAREVRTGDAAMLDRLAASASVRMDDPAVDSRDEALSVTVCKATMTIDLPPGLKDAFNGDQQLAANVKYAVQAGADQGARTYLLEGVDPIVYRLAAIDLKSGLLVQRSPAPPQRTARAVSPDPRPRAEAVATRRSTGPEPRLTARGRPSFNCRASRSRAELMVCSDERLAALDRVAASLYDGALDNARRGTRTTLRGSQSRFLARRDRCGNPGCVAAAYRDRMDEIDRIAAGG
jgi:hypothetical protein